MLASYNHLGNNDMRNLLDPAPRQAKLRVKRDIFAPWQATLADLDHQARARARARPEREGTETPSPNALSSRNARARARAP